AGCRGMNSAFKTKKKNGATIIRLRVTLSAAVIPSAYVFDSEYVKVIVWNAHCGQCVLGNQGGRVKGTIVLWKKNELPVCAEAS
ncbi:MAG: hypothetical protein ABFC92_02615, partial [Rectinema sp.]